MAEVSPEAFIGIRSISRRIRDYTNHNIKFVKKVITVLGEYRALPNGNSTVYKKTYHNGTPQIKCLYLDDMKIC